MAYRVNNTRTFDLAMWCKYDGTDQVAHLTTAISFISAIGGGILLLTGVCSLASASLHGTPISLPSNITFQGINPDVSQFVVTGSSEVTPVFRSVNQSNISFIGISGIGNGINAGTLNTAGFWWNQQTGSAAITRYRVIDCKFDNFAMSNWLMNENTGTAKMSDMLVQGNQFISRVGNNVGHSASNVSASMMDFYGVLAGKFEGVRVINNIAFGDHVKNFCAIWSNVYNVTISGNYLYNFGSDTDVVAPPNDVQGSYAIFCYDVLGSNVSDQHPADINMIGNHIYLPRSVGIYCAGARNVFISGGTISGQSDSTDISLPWGGIGWTQSSGIIQGVEISECRIGINFNIAAQNLDVSLKADELHIDNVIIKSAVANAIGINGSGTGHAVDTYIQAVKISNCSIQLSNASSYGIVLLGSASGPFGDITISEVTIRAKLFGIQLQDGAAGSIIANSVTLSNILLAGAMVNYFLYMPAATSPVSINNLVIDGTGSSAHGFNIQNSTKLNINGLIAKNFTNTGAGQVAGFLTGCKGNMRGVYQDGNSNLCRITSADFGIVVPTYSATTGTFIQNLQPSAGHVSGFTNISAGGAGTTWDDH